MRETLKTLCALPGVSGGEDEVRAYILERVLPHADSIDTDAMGNLIVFKKGKVFTERRLMLCAHMDEIGFIVTGITDEGYLRFNCVGGIDRRVIAGKKVRVGAEAIRGIIGIKAVHLTTAEERRGVAKVDELYIDIGCVDKAEAEAKVALGDFCVFDEGIVEFGAGWLKAKAIDDRVGCSAMVKLIESELPCDVTFVFTVQEEVGARGAGAAAFGIAPDVCLVLEGTTATDLPDIADAKRICTAGNGVVIPFMDNGTVYDRGMFSFLSALADKKNIKWQTKTRVAGGTDGYAVQRSRAGVRVAALSCAVRNIHSPSCVLKFGEADDLLALAYSFLEEFAAGADF